MQSGFVIQWCLMLIMITINTTDGTAVPKCDTTCRYTLMKGSSHNMSEGILHVQDPTNLTNWLPVCWADLDFRSTQCLQRKIDSQSMGIYVFPDEELHFPNTIVAKNLVNLTSNMCSQNASVSYDLCTETAQSGCCNPLAICLQSSHASHRISDCGPAECSRNWTGAQSKNPGKQHCAHLQETLSMSRISRENTTTQSAGRAWTASAFQKMCGGDNETIIKNVESGLNRCLQDWNTRRDQPNNYAIIDKHLNCSWSPKNTCPHDQGMAFTLLESEELNHTKDLYCIAADVKEGWHFTVEKCTTLLPPFCGKSVQSTTKHFKDMSPPQPPTVSSATYTSPNTQTHMKVVVIAITVPTSVSVVTLVAIGIWFWYARQINRSCGGSPRVNSIINQTYGEQLDETYHLLDESRLDENPHPPLPSRDEVHELSVLDAYSLPRDSLVPELTRVDNELTYEDQLTSKRKGQAMLTGRRKDPRAFENSRQRATRKALSEDNSTIDSSIVGYNCLHDSLPKDYTGRSSVIINARIKKSRSDSNISYHIKHKNTHIDNSLLEASVNVEKDFKSAAPTHIDFTMETVLNETQDDSSVSQDVCRQREQFLPTPQMDYSDCISTNKKGAVGDEYVDTESFVELDEVDTHTLFKDHVCLDCLTQEQLDKLGIRIVDVDDTTVTYENLPNRFSDPMLEKFCNIRDADTNSEEATLELQQSCTIAKAKTQS